MRAHQDDLRDEVDDEALVEAVGRGAYRDASLSAAQRAMLDFAYKLTKEPNAMSKADTDRLRAAGFDDQGIHDITQVVAFFNYINRIADGLGVDPEPDWT